MSSPSTPATWFADNRANWDDRAALHEASGYGIQRLVSDPAAMSDELAQDRERLGDLAGRDVIHLQCHLGTDTVGLARLGARRVVGVDLSGESLRRARDIARRCAGPATGIEYVEANVYDARQAVTGDFDLVYTSLGVLCWLPDVAAWGRVVASLLRPGGRLLLRDDHPVFMTIGEDVSHGVTHQWNHSVGEILTSLLGAGLVLDSFEETRHAAWCPWPDLMVLDEQGWRLRENPERLPLQFVLTAHRPA